MKAKGTNCFYLAEKTWRFVPQNRQLKTRGRFHCKAHRRLNFFRNFLQKFHRSFEGLEILAKWVEMTIRSPSHPAGEVRYSVQFANDTALDLSKGTKKHGNNFRRMYWPIKSLYGTWLVFHHKKKTIPPLQHAASCCTSLWSTSNFSLILWERHDGGQQRKIDPQSSLAPWPMGLGPVWKSTHATRPTYGAR